MDSVSASRRSLASFAEEIHSRKGNFSLTAESNSQVEITFVKCPRKSKFLNALLGSKVTITIKNGAVGSEAQMQEIKTSTRKLGKDLAELEKQLKQQGVGNELSWREQQPDRKTSLSNLDIDSIEPLPLDDSDESTDDSKSIADDSKSVSEEYVEVDDVGLLSSDSGIKDRQNSSSAPLGQPNSIESLLPNGSSSVTAGYVEVDDVDSFSSDGEIKDRQNDPSIPQKQAVFLHPGKNRGKVSTFDPDEVEDPTNSLSASGLSDDPIDAILEEDPIDSPEKLGQDKKAAADFLEKLNNGDDL